MKLNVTEQGTIELGEVYSGVDFRTKEGDVFNICMRDSGYEFNYGGSWYSAQDGKITPFPSPIETAIKNHVSSSIPHTNGSGVLDVACSCGRKKQL